MSTTLPAIGNPIAGHFRSRPTSPLIYVALLVIGLIVGLLAITSLGSNKNETFSFVGSSIRPDGGGGGGNGGNNAAGGGGNGGGNAGGGDNKGGNGAKDDPLAKAESVERKIVYSATLELIVKDVEQASAAINGLLAANQARLSQSDTYGVAGTRRSSTVTLEVQVNQFRPLLTALKQLGATQREEVNSKDVTEEYVDLKARLKNLREQEDKLNELLKEKRQAERLEDIIRVSDRIAEVRQVVERTEGRMKYIDAKAAFSTITLTLREVQDYQPAPPPSAPTPPTFDERITTSFGKSWALVVAFAHRFVLFFVAITPWLPVIIPVGIALVWLAPRLLAEHNASQQAVAKAEPTSTIKAPDPE